MPEEEPVVELRPEDFLPRRVMIPGPPMVIYEGPFISTEEVKKRRFAPLPVPKSALERISGEDLF